MGQSGSTKAAWRQNTWIYGLLCPSLDVVHGFIGLWSVFEVSQSGSKNNRLIESVSPAARLVPRCCPKYLELSDEAVLCVCVAGREWGCECRGTGGISHTGSAVMGGRMGREEGTMYSDSSSLLRVSSAVPGLRTGEGLRMKGSQTHKLVSASCVDFSF